MIFSDGPNSPDSLDAILETLLRATEARDAELRRHSERVAQYALQLAIPMGFDAATRQVLHLGALLHDIGNIGIPDSILLKPSGLSEWELDEMKLHPIIGEKICRPIAAFRAAMPLVRSHHEKLDGSGYPDGLAGREIPPMVRLLSVADVYDTLRSDRSYRDAFGHDEALEILNQEARRGWWDTEIVGFLAALVTPVTPPAKV